MRIISSIERPDPLRTLRRSKADRHSIRWSALEKKWNGVLLNGLKVVLQCALRMTWKGRHPTVKRLDGAYPDGVRVPAKEMKQYEARLQRSATLPKYA